MSESSEPKNQASQNFDDVQSDYANNVGFEATIWDLKLLFGEYSQRANAVEWHTSITIPWAQAKLMVYFLQLNIDVHESSAGPIEIPTPAIPQEPTPPPNPENQGEQRFYEIIKRNREWLLKPRSEAD